MHRHTDAAVELLATAFNRYAAFCLLAIIDGSAVTTVALVELWELRSGEPVKDRTIQLHLRRLAHLGLIEVEAMVGRRHIKRPHYTATDWGHRLGDATRDLRDLAVEMARERERRAK